MLTSLALATGDDAACECKTAAVIRRAYPVTTTAEQCEVILLCEPNADSPAVCVCSDQATYAAADDAAPASVVADACIQTYGTNGVSFGFGDIGASTLLIVLVAVSGICGCCGLAVGLTKERQRNSHQMFFVVEGLDAAMDIASYKLATGTGDLVFSNDDGLVSTVLGICVWLSVIVYLLELCAFTQREELGVEFAQLIPYLLCLHVITEDFFQTLVYTAVGASHSSVPGAVWFGIIQAFVFTCAKMYELCSEGEVDIGTSG